ncbi:MAG: hypothetical protein ACRD3L_13105 [Terriglobales bacterium]
MIYFPLVEKLRAASARVRLLAAIDAGDAADDAAEGEHAFIVSQKNFTAAMAAVVPALQKREVLHGFESAFCGLRRGGQGFLDA